MSRWPYRSGPRDRVEPEEEKINFFKAEEIVTRLVFLAAIVVVALDLLIWRP